MPTQDSPLHPRNRNQDRYDLAAMQQTMPAIAEYIQSNKNGEDSINFSDPRAVKMLNRALLHHYYGIEYWDYPDEHLTPPIPGRADYIHYVADLLSESLDGALPQGRNYRCLDIGTGATMIYPIIAVAEYGWQCIGTDIHLPSLKVAEAVANMNPKLRKNIRLRRQKNSTHILEGIIRENDNFDILVCNPPFHSSVEEAEKGTRRKLKNLSGKTQKKPTLNFSGIHPELITEGGELQFISTLISESDQYSGSCFWYSCLVSKESNLEPLQKHLAQYNPAQTRVIDLFTGNKKARILVWSYYNEEDVKAWRESKHKSKSQLSSK